MKRLILILIMMISVASFAQPSAKKNPPQKSGGTSTEVAPKLDIIEVQGVYRTDTVNVKLTIEDEEGYLKRIVGKIVVRSFTPVQGNPQAIEQKYYDNGWKQIPAEKVDRWVQIPAALTEQKPKN